MSKIVINEDKLKNLIIKKLITENEEVTKKKQKHVHKNDNFIYENSGSTYK